MAVEGGNPFERRVFYIVKTDGKVVRAPLRAVNEIAFERHFHTSLKKGLDAENEEQAAHTYWLAYQCEGKVTAGLPPFEEWVDMLDTIDLRTETVPFSGGPPAMP
jgi:hypothetical protein